MCICWLDSCRVLQKHKNPMRLAMYRNEGLKWPLKQPCRWKFFVPVIDFLYWVVWQLPIQQIYLGIKISNSYKNCYCRGKKLYLAPSCWGKDCTWQYCQLYPAVPCSYYISRMQGTISLLRHSHPDQEGTKGPLTRKSFLRFLSKIVFLTFQSC